MTFDALPFLATPPDSSLLYVGEYRFSQVALSVLVAMVASYAALYVASRLVPAQRGRARLAWLGVAGLTLGGGVWAMHFIGMMALVLPCAVDYSPAVTLLSMAPAILASGVALAMVTKSEVEPPSLLFASALLGAGIGAMHYTGMAAMRLDGLVRYDPVWFMLSLAVAVALAWLALRTHVGLRRARRRRDALAAVIMGAAVSGMHYTAMASAYFLRGDDALAADSSLSPTAVSAVVAVVAGLFALLALALAALAYNRRMTRQLRESERRWSFALEGGGDCVWDWDLRTGEVHLSKAGAMMFGYDDGEIGATMAEWEERAHPEDKARMLDEIRQYFKSGAPNFSSEYRVRCKDGNWKWILTRGMAVERDAAGRTTRMIGTHADMTERKRAEEIIQYQAHFDPLTQLPNRRLFRDRLDQALKKAARGHAAVALLLIDLDRFKEVNDTLGHDMGDSLLLEAAARISSCVRESDTVARLGGDEFAVVLSDLADAGGVDHIAQNILGRLVESFEVGTHKVFVSASIGIAVFPDDGADIDSLLKHVDQAMYAAKNAGRNCFSYFTPALQEAAQERMRLAADLRGALDADQFVVHYQPIVDMASGRICKAEALIRWLHPQQGLISPMRFIPLAEETGLIVPIGDWVFRDAAAQVRRWRETVCADFQVSVNKSPVQFRAGKAEQGRSWEMLLGELGLPGQSIVVEITEGLLLRAEGDVMNRFIQFRNAGIQVAIDDFGTGYSSLAYLKKFDIDYLKIDRSFVRNLETDGDDMALCEAIIAMAHKLGLKVIAEGIETERQRELLASAGCDYGQGYLFAKPMPAHEIDALLAAAPGTRM